MKFRDMLAIVSSEAEDGHVISFAEQLRRQWAVRITTLVTKWKPDFVLTNAADDLRAEVERTMTRLRRAPEVRPSSPNWLRSMKRDHPWACGRGTSMLSWWGAPPGADLRLAARTSGRGAFPVRTSGIRRTGGLADRACRQQSNGVLETDTRGSASSDRSA